MQMIKLLKSGLHLSDLKHKIEGGVPARACRPNLEQQIRAEQRVRSVLCFAREIELRRQNRAMRSLQTHVIMTCSTRIQARHNRLESVPSGGIGELVSPATKAFEIVGALAIGMPEVDQSSGYGPYLTVKYNAREPYRGAGYARFAEVGFQRRAWPEKGTSGFLWRQFEL